MEMFGLGHELPQMLNPIFYNLEWILLRKERFFRLIIHLWFLDFGGLGLIILQMSELFSSLLEISISDVVED